jgi:PAS domain S-box-containing protein
MKPLPLDQQIRGLRDLVFAVSQQINNLPPHEISHLYSDITEIGAVFHEIFLKIPPGDLAHHPTQKSCPTAEIRRINERLTAILDDLDDGFLTLDRNWTITYINRRAAQNGGQEPPQIIGRSIWEVFPQLVGTALESHYHLAMEQRVSSRFDMKGVIRDQWYSVSVHPTEEGISVYWLDISERKRLEAEEFRVVFDGITDAVVVFNADGFPSRLNPAAQRAYGANMLEMDRIQSSRRINLRRADGSQIPLPCLPVSRALRGEIIHNERLLLSDPQGRDRTVLASANPLRDAEGEIHGACLVWNDITEVEAAQQAVQESQDQLEFHHRLIEHQEEAVVQIARELHDGPLQNLVAVLFEIQALTNDLERNIPLNPSSQIETLEQIKITIQRQIDHLRSYSAVLHPPVISKFGLQAAIQSHLEMWQEHNPSIRTTLETQPGSDNLSEKTRMALFRVYQEALANITRHSQASQVFIRLHKKPGVFELIVQDNGRGFTVPDDLIAYARQGKFGFVGIQERLEAVQGRFDLITQPGEGTYLQVIVPITIGSLINLDDSGGIAPP